MTSAVLRFPGERLGTFISSFGAADVASCEIIGTQGKLRLDPAYEYAMALKLFVTIDGKTRTRTFPRRDQFAPELLYFQIASGKISNRNRRAKRDWQMCALSAPFTARLKLGNRSS